MFSQKLFHSDKVNVSSFILRSEVFFPTFLSAYLAKIELRIEIFMLKLVCSENLVLFGHSGRELQRFEDLVFSIN